MEETTYRIQGVNGPIVTVVGGRGLAKMSLVRVGELHLAGEVVSVQGERAIVQVYEETSGLTAGQPVFPTNRPLSVTLGPGMIGTTYDGIARPLKAIEGAAGCFIPRGVDLPSVDMQKLWDVTVDIREGDALQPGQVFARVQETGAVEHRSMVPPGVFGEAEHVKPSGRYTVGDTICEVVAGHGRRVPLTLCQVWPVRTPRPAKSRLPITKPLFTGQRVLDTLFPVGKGGCAAIPGPFGAGKTMVQHQLAKWCDADIIVYLGCGERGNEMTQVLDEFSELKDPRSGQPLLQRTILIANTSNMPVAAREASIYTGMTIAEYFRDMGLHVALMADSTSRWAEALREISGRLEEMPAEESFPAYLPSRLADFYERAGYVCTLGGQEGSVTVIGAVSPQGGDFSEPVTQNTKRCVRTFWALDRSLAYARHFPAINWNDSYSEYFQNCREWYEENYGPGFTTLRERIMALLHEETSLQEIVKLVGQDVLPDDQRLTLLTARVIREGFLQQNAFLPTDAYMPAQLQMNMLEVIMHLYDQARELVSLSVPVSQLEATGIFTDLARMKFGFGEGKTKDDYLAMVDHAVDAVRKANV